MDEQTIMASHLESNKQEFAKDLNFTVFSITKFDVHVDDATLLA